MIKEISDEDWIYLINESALENNLEISEELKKEKHGTLGKYLFFSDNQNLYNRK